MTCVFACAAGIRNQNPFTYPLTFTLEEPAVGETIQYGSHMERRRGKADLLPTTVSDLHVLINILIKYKDYPIVPIADPQPRRPRRRAEEHPMEHPTAEQPVSASGLGWPPLDFQHRGLYSARDDIDRWASSLRARTCRCPRRSGEASDVRHCVAAVAFDRTRAKYNPRSICSDKVRGARNSVCDQ